mmetsp:Transcript_31123/g.95688  ORF Transcript_31123/g.95688 Transcript_31123/m.95688 type:complete len:254 (-) Transcript_31123:1491-2252(-)
MPSCHFLYSRWLEKASVEAAFPRSVMSLRLSSTKARACSLRSFLSYSDMLPSSSWPSAESAPPLPPISSMTSPTSSAAGVSRSGASSPSAGSWPSAFSSSSSSGSELPPWLASAMFVRASAMYSSFSSKDTVTTRQPHFRSSRRLNIAEPVRLPSTDSRASPSTSSRVPQRTGPWPSSLPSPPVSPNSARICSRGMVIRLGPSTSMMSRSFSMTTSARTPGGLKPSSEGGKALARCVTPCMRKRSARRMFCRP